MTDKNEQVFLKLLDAMAEVCDVINATTYQKECVLIEYRDMAKPAWKCSCCDKRIYDKYAALTANYCPECGSKIIEVD